VSGRVLHAWIMRAVLALVLIVVLAPQGAFASAEVVYGQGLLWRVERPGDTPSHLFGTMHSNHPDITRLPEPVAAALDGARSFGLELVLSADAAGQLRAASMLPRGRDLQTLLGPARFERVADLAWSYGVPVSALHQLKPWAVMQVLSLPPAEFARLSERRDGPALDLLLQRRAAARGVVIFGLESPSEQIAMFDDLPVANQIAFLDASIADNARIDWWWRTIKEAYLARDIGAIYQLMSESRMADDPELMRLFKERAIEQRNERMVERMARSLAKGNAFIAVGALHLPGERGVLNLLAQQGYAITRVY
jgi:uncharacterized protein YbaP (TraB family)